MGRPDSRLKLFARDLRKNQTDAEQLLWSRIRRKQLLGYRFNRQRPIGPYIVDFYCAGARLILELDGGQHFEDRGKANDGERDARLGQQGLTVLRFSNRDVLENIEGVLTTIVGFLQQLP